MCMCVMYGSYLFSLYFKLVLYAPKFLFNFSFLLSLFNVVTVYFKFCLQWVWLS